MGAAAGRCRYCDCVRVAARVTVSCNVVVHGQDVLVNVKTTPILPKYVLPVELQGQWESRRCVPACTAMCQPRVVWHAQGVRSGVTVS